MLEKVYIISHVPKTAGTSIRVHLQKHMTDQVDFIHLANKGHKWAAEKGMKPFPERTETQRNQAQVVFGHQVNYQTKALVNLKQAVEIVYFRTPIKWEISRFNQYNNHLVNAGEEPISFEHWAHHIEKTHSQFEWFLGNYLCLKGEVKKLSHTAKTHLLMNTLEQFDHVFFTEDFGLSSQYLFKQLGVATQAERENVVGVHKKDYFNHSADELAMINQLCAPDIELYQQLQSKFPLVVGQ